MLLYKNLLHSEKSEDVMSRIRIEDIPTNAAMGKEEMKRVTGGFIKGCSLGAYFSNPWMFGGIVAAAIAIPPVNPDHDDDN